MDAARQRRVGHIDLVLAHSHWPSVMGLRVQVATFWNKILRRNAHRPK